MPRKKTLLSMPVLPLRGMMVFPRMVIHFDVGRSKSIAALEEAMGADGLPMFLHVLTGSAIGGIAFDNRSFDVIDQFTDEFGVKIVVSAHFAR